MAAKSDTVKTDGDYNQWLEEELVPILVDAFGQDAEYWREVARGAKRYIDMLVSEMPNSHSSTKSALLARLGGLRLHS